MCRIVVHNVVACGTSSLSGFFGLVGGRVLPLALGVSCPGGCCP